jgi:hypothetical protein
MTNIVIETPNEAMEALTAVYNFLRDNGSLNAPNAQRKESAEVAAWKAESMRPQPQPSRHEYSQDDYSNQVESRPTPVPRKRNQWMPTWAVQFGPHKGKTLHTIAREAGPEALIPYRQRGVDQVAYPRPGENQDAHREINRTMVEAIDEILRQYKHPIPHQSAQPPRRNGAGRGGRGSGSNGGAHRQSGYRQSSQCPPREKCQIGYSSNSNDELLTENQERAIWAAAISLWGKHAAEDELTAMLRGQEVGTLRKRDASRLIDRLNEMKDED